VEVRTHEFSNDMYDHLCGNLSGYYIYPNGVYFIASLWIRPLRLEGVWIALHISI
jgi:hypothetical protein